MTFGWVFMRVRWGKNIPDGGTKKAILRVGFTNKFLNDGQQKIRGALGYGALSGIKCTLDVADFKKGETV